MKAVLRGISGPGGGSYTLIDDGVRISVGTDAACTVSLPSDRFMSAVHFEISVSLEQLFLRDLDSHSGTFVNGVRVREYVLYENDSILAGESSFDVLFHAVEPPDVADVLSSQPEPLYAILDAARDPTIYPMLVSSGGYYWSLYTGKSASELVAVAPYLVYLWNQHELLQMIVNQGWGKSWGVFLTSAQAPEAIWHGLRRSLMVTLEDTQKLVYFRFYDPRVLRMFLPIANIEQRTQFAGTAISFMTEDEAPDKLIRFQFFQGNCHIEKFRVRSPESS